MNPLEKLKKLFPRKSKTIPAWDRFITSNIERNQKFLPDFWMQLSETDKVRYCEEYMINGTEKN